jgi:hypothetical protein
VLGALTAKCDATAGGAKVAKDLVRSEAWSELALDGGAGSRFAASEAKCGKRGFGRRSMRMSGSEAFHLCLTKQ